MTFLNKSALFYKYHIIECFFNNDTFLKITQLVSILFRPNVTFNKNFILNIYGKIKYNIIPAP